MEKLQVGSKVRVIRCDGEEIVPLGTIGKVVAQHGQFSNSWVVEFDCNPARRWWFDEDELEAIPLP